MASTPRKGKAAIFVATSILVSRLAGLVRVSVFSHYFGLKSDAADAWNAAFKIPNFLQTLFGEGALSASFIPVYASLLALMVSIIVLVGVVATPLFIDTIAIGWTGEKRELTTQLVRILFPGAGLL